MLSSMVFCTNYSNGQDYIIRDNVLVVDGPTTFIQTNPYPTGTTTICSLEVGKSFNTLSYRALFYGGNLGVSQSTSTFGTSGSKESFIGAWDKYLGSMVWSSPTTFTPGFSNLVNFHRWGDYSAHFGLQTSSTTWTSTGGVITKVDADLKDAVISWASEFGATPNRLIFQSMDGVDASGLNPFYQRELATILSNGNIGSGISSPSAQFQLRPFSSSATIPMFEILDFSNNSKLIFKSGKLGLSVSNPTEVFDVLGNFKLTGNQSLTGNFTQTGNLALTGNANIIGSTFLDGFLTIRGNTSAGFVPLTITDNAGIPNNLFVVDNLGDVRIPNGDLYFSTITGAGIPTTTFYNNILAINSTGQVVSGPAPTANTLWEMGGNNLTATGTIGSKSDYDVDFKVGATPILAYKVHGVSSTYRGSTEFNKPVSIGVTPDENWTLYLKSVGTTVGAQGVLNCVSTTGTTIFKVDNGGNMYLPSPSMSPGAGTDALLAIDGNNGQVYAASATNTYWNSAGNSFTTPFSASGVPHKFGSTSSADDKIEFYAGGNKVFDIWTSPSGSNMLEGSTNFSRNVSIQGGSHATGFPGGNGGLPTTAAPTVFNCNDVNFSLNIQTALSTGQPFYSTKGILRCVDGGSNDVMTVGASEIRFFNGYTKFTSNSSQDLINLMRSGNMLSNVLTVFGQTKVYNSILPDRTPISGVTLPTPYYINLGSTGDKFDYLYTKNIDATNIVVASGITATNIEASNNLKGKYAFIEKLTPVGGIISAIGEAGVSGNPPLAFEQIWGRHSYVNNLYAMNYSGVALTSHIGEPTIPFNDIYGTNVYGNVKVESAYFKPKSAGVSDIGASGEEFDDIWGKDIFPKTGSAPTNIGASGAGNGFDNIYGDNINVDYLIPINGGFGGTSDIGSSGNYFNVGYAWNWNSLSDERLKTDVKPINNSLNKLMLLNPVSYNFYSEKSYQPCYGFLAQELEKIFPIVVSTPKTQDGYYSVTYDELIPVVIKGIQEQQIIINDQKASIDLLNQKLDLVFATNQIKDSKNITSQKEVLNKVPLLFQNHPNPFNGVTFIDYFLPDNTTNAFLKVVDNNGKLVKAFPINTTGFGQIELDCSNLAQGTYYYSLLVNGQIIDTKNMIIATATDY